jgi:hypothetical protein
MAKCEQIPPLLTRRSVALTGFPAQIELPRNTDDDKLLARSRGTLHSAFAGIALKTSIDLKAGVGFSTQPYVSGVGYMASQEEYGSFCCRDISSWVRFVPIRDDPEMVVNLGLRAAEAGLRRLGVAA